MKSDEYCLNKMKYYLDFSEYEDNFLITNVDFNYYWNSNFNQHFANWYNEGDNDYIIMVNTTDRIRQLENAGIDSKMILQRKEYTKLMKCRDYKREWIYDYIRKGKIIMYDIADIRLFEYQKFYFGVSKRTDEKHITRDVSYHSSGHIVVQKFDRIVYISREVKNRYLKQKNRIQRVDKILNS